MNEAVKNAALGVSLGGVIWLSTGMWQFFVVTLIGMACVWVTTPPVTPQPRRRVREFERVKIREDQPRTDQER
jgi:hypothetical protein